MVAGSDNNYRFSVNDVVAHIENLSQKMIVREIKRRKVFQSTGEPDETTGGFKKVEKNKIDGIVVYWFEEISGGRKIMKEEKFHSELLVPFTVAQEGQEAADKWLEVKTKLKIK